MDRKTNQKVGEVRGAGDTRYLQQELGHVLPAALATLTELQPSDPITILALWLYKYRELNPLPAHMADTSGTPVSSNNEPSSIKEAETVTDSSMTHTHAMKPVQTLPREGDDCDDFIEDMGYLDPTLKKADVHREVVPIFSVIGDLFDDDDLR